MNYIRRKINDVKVYDPAKAYNGYTLFATGFSKDAWLINMEGEIVHHWKMKSMSSGEALLLPNGNLMWLGRGPDALVEFPNNGSELIEVDWDGNEVWKYEDPYINHDFACLRNGNTIVCRYVEVPQKIAGKIKGGLPGTELNGKIYSCGFREINKKREIVWEWNHYDHLNTETDILCPLCTREIWGYTNAVEELPNGNILFTLRRLNKVAILDKDSGEIVWQSKPELGLGHPHNSTVLENGNILLFDNGLHRKPDGKSIPPDISEIEYSSILEINPNNDKLKWEYTDHLGSFYSPYCGGAERLPNGNTLICETIKGRFFEVTYDKKIVWEYLNPFLARRPAFWRMEEALIAHVFRAHRYGPDYAGFKGKEFDPFKYEWIVHKRKNKTKEDIEEDKLLKRLKDLGY